MPLSLDVLKSEPDYFELADGVKIPFLVRSDMTLQQSAQWGRFIKRLQNAERQFDKARTDAQRVFATQKRAEVNRDMVKFMLPTLPDEILDSLTLPMMGDIIGYWLRTARIDEEDIEGN